MLPRKTAIKSAFSLSFFFRIKAVSGFYAIMKKFRKIITVITKGRDGHFRQNYHLFGIVGAK